MTPNELNDISSDVVRAVLQGHSRSDVLSDAAASGISHQQATKLFKDALLIRHSMIRRTAGKKLIFSLLFLAVGTPILYGQLTEAPNVSGRIVAFGTILSVIGVNLLWDCIESWFLPHWKSGSIV